MRALDEYEQLYGKIRHPETGALKPGVVLIEDTDEAFMVQYHNRDGEQVVMGYTLCSFPFWRNRERRTESERA